MSRAMPAWCADPGEISRLLRYLHSNDPLDVVDCIAIVEKPWHWDEEYQEMCRVQVGPQVAKCEEEDIETARTLYVALSVLSGRVARGGG